jgi:hypothetical protein
MLKILDSCFRRNDTLHFVVPKCISLLLHMLSKKNYFGQICSIPINKKNVLWINRKTALVFNKKIFVKV